MKVFWVDAVGSTNTEALEQARKGVPHGWALGARRQTGGRGRLGRVWEEGEGNLYLSVVLRPRVAPDQLPWVTLGAGVVVADCLGEPFRLKWPNDVLDGQDRKVAGILAEAEWTSGRLDGLVVGIGINLTHSPSGVPATCLAEHGRSVDRRALAEMLRQRLADLDFSSVPARWKARSCTLGRSVHINGVRGVAEDLDVDGALLVRTAGGLQRVVTGDLGFTQEVKARPSDTPTD